MSEKQFGYKVRQILNQGTQLEDGVSARLEISRELALSKQRVSASYLSPVAVASGVQLDSQSQSALLWPRILSPIALLIACFLLIQSWRQVQLAEEIEEIDAAVLTGDLPIDAYMDNGFDVWLKRTLP